MLTRQELADEATSLAVQGVYIGTSSWKYPGWCGMIYDRSRYEYRGKFAETRFKRDCLAEYAEVFKTVCVDAAYYSFPSQQYLESMINQVPDDFMFGLKVTDSITIRKFPTLDRFGEQAGKANENFLNAELFAKAFLKPCEVVRSNIGLLMFEFSRFWPTDYEHGRDFIADLDKFLGQLPKGWPYGVEMRNRNWLKPEYFECLARHEVAHVFNSWEAMPPVGEQMALPGSRTNPDLVAARFLLKIFRDTGLLNPYDRKKAPNLDKLVQAWVADYHQRKSVAKEAGVDIEKVPCLGHPVFNQETINYDPRERVISRYLDEHKLYNVFLDFYHRLTKGMMDQGVTSKVHAVNVDAVITCVCMGMAWPLLVEKKITVERALDLPFLTFALGRVVGGAAEYLDHRESGTDMDMRVPVAECKAMVRARD